MPTQFRGRSVTMVATIVAALVAAAVLVLGLGHAASLTVTSATLAVHHPEERPGVDCPDPQTVHAVGDTYVAQDNPNINFGTAPDLRVRSWGAGGGRNRRTLVRFDLPAMPGGCVVASAELRLYTQSTSAGRTLHTQRIAAAWAETTATWANQPDVTGTVVATPSAATNGTWIAWDVTNHAVMMYSTGTNHGWRIVDSVESSPGNTEQVFSSRESAIPANHPRLTVSYEQEH